jgi:endonuclease/exonuclease/phosphatase (EEP) superfamily protein YafD
MRSLLETDRRPPPTEPARPRRVSRRARWILAIATVALVVAAALGFLITDQITAYDQFGRARTSLGVTRQHTQTVSAQLTELTRDLRVLRTQVGNDTTALNQDAAQLLGAQTSLSAAQAHVTQQASLIGSLKTCLGGVEQALNALAVGNQPQAIAALNAVSSSCTAAEASSG